MKERILKILEKNKLSSAQFAELIGVQRSSISHILSGRNKPSYDFLVKIIEHFDDIDAQWLLTGKGNMSKIQRKPAPYSTNQQELFTQPDYASKGSSNSGEQQVLNKNKDDSEPIPAAIEQIIKHEAKSEEKPRVTNVNKVKMIVFVYEDNTFEIINKK